MNLLEIKDKTGALVAYITPTGDFHCNDKAKMIEVLESTAEAMKATQEALKNLNESLITEIS